MVDLVSVIIPTFKRPETLKRAVKSVLNQSYIQLELLIVNDDENDDDDIGNLLNSFNDDRIIYLKNKRKKGANGARNTGIVCSTGKYIAFLDDDDEWFQNKLITQLEYLQSKPKSFGAVYSGYLIENKNKWLEYRGIKEGSILSEIILDRVKVCTGSNLLVKKDIFKSIGLWNEELLRQQDLEFLIRMLQSYDLAYDDNIVARIYGHNTPKPNKAFQEREKFVTEISKNLEPLSIEEKNKFYSDHYRRQAYYLIEQEKYKDAIAYWKKATSYKWISLRKDVKLLYHLINK